MPIVVAAKIVLCPVLAGAPEGIEANVLRSTSISGSTGAQTEIKEFIPGEPPVVTSCQFELEAELSTAVSIICNELPLPLTPSIVAYVTVSVMVVPLAANRVYRI